MNERILDGKIALITGVSSGLGQASALMFARYGAKLVLGGVHEQGGEETALRIREGGGQAIYVRADVTRSGDVEALVGRAVEHYGRLDCAVNNAGTEGPVGATVDCTEEEWDRVMAVNLKGVFLCMKYEIPRMVERGGGAIVNMSSVAGLIGMAGLSAYVASKHGVIGITKSAAIEYGKRGVRINAICPCTVRTPMMDRLLRTKLVTEQGVADALPLGRLGAPDEVAEAAAWLCSDRASFTTGHALAVDGGYVAM